MSNLKKILSLLLCFVMLFSMLPTAYAEGEQEETTEEAPVVSVEEEVPIEVGSEEPEPEHVCEYEAVVTEPTCTEQGYTTYTCPVCGNSYTDDLTDTLGHTEEAVAEIPAEAGKPGRTAGTVCSVCGIILSGCEEIPALPEPEAEEPTEPIPAEPTPEPEPEEEPEEEIVQEEMADAGTVVASGNCGENGSNVKWTLYSDGELVISGSGKMKTVSGQYDVPWSGRLSSIKKVTVESGVTYVFAYAFQNATNLTEASLANTITSMGGHAFADCTSLWKVNIPTGVDRVGLSWFSGCTALRNITIPSNVTIIRKSAFYGCRALSNVTIPNTVTTIEETAFYDCQGLESITIPGGIATIGKSAFYNCLGLTELTISDGVTSIGEKAFSNCNSLQTITIPSSVSSIGTGAFSGNCINWDTTVTLNEGLISIGASAFNQRHINSITIPASVESIGSSAFSFSNLKTITFHGDAPSFGENCFYRCSSTTAYYPSDLDWPSSVRQNYGGTVTWVAFDYCPHRNLVTDPAVAPTCTETGLSEGSHCADCQEVLVAQEVVPALGHDWGSAVYEWAENNSSVTATRICGRNSSHVETETVETVLSVTTEPTYESSGAGIYTATFMNTAFETQTKEVVLPMLVHQIIASGTCGAEGDNLTWELEDTGILTIRGSGAMVDLRSYQNAQWYTYRDSITSVVIEPGATKIGEYAFKGCSNMQSIAIPPSVASVGDSAFTSCSGLTDVWYSCSEIFWNGVYIYQYGNGSLKSAQKHFLDATHSVVFSGECGAQGDNLLWTLDDTGLLSFSGSGEMEEFSKYLIGNSNYTTAPWYLYHRVVLSVDFGGATTVGSYTFYFCHNLTECELPSGMTAVGESAFWACEALTEITIPLSLQSVGEAAFDRCTNLADVYYEGSVLDWNSISIADLNEPLLNARLHSRELEWSEPSYSWADDNSSVTATRTCLEDTGLIETETVEPGYEVTLAAGCETSGTGIYTAEFENEAFVTQTKEVTIPATGHDWSEAGYTWTEDNSTVTAVRTCTNNSSHVETETVESNYAVTTEPGCETAGVGTYTAEFEKDGFTTQTKEVEIPALDHDWGDPEYSWTIDNTKVTAWRTCTRDSSHIDTETANTSYAVTTPAGCETTGIGTYTAEFENAAFAAQTKEVEIPATDHAWSEPEYVWAEDNSTVTATRVCANNSEHSETETVRTTRAVSTVSGQCIVTYTAEFTNPVFTTQTKEVDSEFEINKTELEMFVNQTDTLKVTNPDGSSVSVLWGSSNPTVASVSLSGVVKAVKPGRAVIGARNSDGEVLARCEVRVLFTDVADPTRYFYEPVYWALDNAITTGAGGVGKFSPNDNCTREQIVTFLWRLMGEPDPAFYTEFTDVPSTAWYYKAISWAAEKGITVGLNDGTGRFGVGQPCTRAMCVTFLWRAAGKPAPQTQGDFTDMRPGAYYIDAVSWAAENNITVGLNDGTGRFGVDNTCTRAMIVTFLYRFAHMS